MCACAREALQNMPPRGVVNAGEGHADQRQAGLPEASPAPADPVPCTDDISRASDGLALRRPLLPSQDHLPYGLAALLLRVHQPQGVQVKWKHLHLWQLERAKVEHPRARIENETLVLKIDLKDRPHEH